MPSDAARVPAERGRAVVAPAATGAGLGDPGSGRGKPSGANGGRIKVVYIAGAGRSGSTVLARLLGQRPDWFDGGEIFRFPENILKDRVCGCGTRFTECAVWSRILASSLGSRLDPRALSWRGLPVRNRHYMIMSKDRVDRNARGSMAAYLASIEEVYRAIAATTKSAVIVDSSKSPVHGHFLELTGAIDLRVVHLVRDPRAVAYSTACRRKPGQRNQSLFSSIHTWIRWNHLTSRFWGRSPTVPYLLLRYEDFVDQPLGAVRRIADLAGEDVPWEEHFEGERDVWLRPTHHVSGNVGKHATGRVRLTLDEEWREQMSRQHRLVTTMCCYPWLTRYGYADAARGRGKAESPTASTLPSA